MKGVTGKATRILLTVAVAGVLCLSEAAAQTAGTGADTTGGANLGNSAPSGGVSPGAGYRRNSQEVREHPGLRPASGHQVVCPLGAV